MNTMELLLAGLAVFEENPGAFTTGAVARNAAGDKLRDATNPYARSWDMLGVLLKCAGVDRFRAGHVEDRASLCLLEVVQKDGHASVREANDVAGRAGALRYMRLALGPADEGHGLRAVEGDAA